jgi:hypothetical protein
VSVIAETSGRCRGRSGPEPELNLAASAPMKSFEQVLRTSADTSSKDDANWNFAAPSHESEQEALGLLEVQLIDYRDPRHNGTEPDVADRIGRRLPDNMQISQVQLPGLREVAGPARNCRGELAIRESVLANGEFELIDASLSLRLFQTEDQPLRQDATDQKALSFAQEEAALSTGLVLLNQDRAGLITREHQSQRGSDFPNETCRQIFDAVLMHQSTWDRGKPMTITGLRLSLRPETLGEIEISLKVKDGALEVNLVTERHATADTLQTASDQLCSSLTELGFEETRLSINFRKESVDRNVGDFAQTAGDMPQSMSEQQKHSGEGHHQHKRRNDRGAEGQHNRLHPGRSGRAAGLYI